jgi:amidase
MSGFMAPDQFRSPRSTGDSDRNYRDPMPRVHAFTDDALGHHDAVGLALALKRGEVSPTEVVEAAMTRLETVDRALNGLARRRYEDGRRDAREIHPHDAFFAGVPTLIKDNSDVAGLPTQHGTDAYVARPARRDGELARLFGELGLITLGKSQLSEWGFSATAEHPRLGAVRSPWDTERVAGASSAGAAALVAAGAIPIAHGNDGGGSIRIPASVNGLVGLKPTRGRIAQDAYFAVIPVNIVADGVLTRTVRDTAAFLREAELVRRSPGLPPIGDVVRAGRRRLRIGFFTSALRFAATPEVDRLTRGTAALLESLGHHVHEIEAPVPATFAEDFVLYWAELAATLVRTGPLRGRTWDPAKLDHLTRGLAEHGLYHLRSLPSVVSSLRRAQAQAEQSMSSYDVVLTPTVSHETPRVGYLDPMQPYEQVLERLMSWVSFTPWANVTGAPSLSLPLATTASGLPQGMMLTGRWGREATLLELAFELEESRPFARLDADL